MNAQPEPQNLPAEDYALCVAMQSPAAIDALQAAGLDPQHFYRPSHGVIYGACLSLHHAGTIAHPVQVIERLAETGDLERVGGEDRVREIASLGEVPSLAGQFARSVIRSARLRQVAARAKDIHTAATASGNADQLEQQLQDLARELTAEAESIPGRYRVTPAAEFLDSFEESAASLLGENGETIVPAGGLVILGGEGGSSKTTLSLDACAHLAAGIPWLGHTVARPLHILIIENEGPRPQFREKLKQKAASWQGAPFLPNIDIWEEPWAKFSFANPADRRALRETASTRQTDLVMCDPLDSLGIQGAGTPEDTRTFVQLLRECGLHDPTNPLAFWILHHYNKQAGGTIVSRLSGAWGNHADTILGLELADGHTSKLTWAKLRHATPPAHLVSVLAWDIASRGFTPLDAEGQSEKRASKLEQASAAILQHVTNHPGLTTIALKTAIADQLHLDRALIDQAIKTSPHLRPEKGPRNATLWHLANTPQQPELQLTAGGSSQLENRSSQQTAVPSGSELTGPPSLSRRERGSEVKSTGDSNTSPPSQQTPPHHQNGAGVVPEGRLPRARSWVEGHVADDPAIVEAELLARGLELGQVAELLAEHRELAAGAQFGEAIEP